MATVTFKEFSDSARKALGEVIETEGSAEIFEAFDRKARQFHFHEDGGTDSLDMLDVCFYIEQELRIRLQFEKMVHNNVPMTVGNLYDSIVQKAVSPA